MDPIAAILGAWSSEIGFWSVLLRLSVSVLFASAIGWERAAKRHAAGLRTFILVSLASTMAMLLDTFLMSSIRLPLLSAATIVAIAILSTNSILFSSKNQIKGLTTSAGLWACGIVGLSLGGGFYTAAAIGFAALLCSLTLFPPIERYLKDKSNHFEVHLELHSKNYLSDFITTIRRLGLRIDDIEFNPAYLNSGLSVYSVSLTIFSPELKTYKKHAEIIEALRSLDYISYIEEMT